MSDYQAYSVRVLGIETHEDRSGPYTVCLFFFCINICIQVNLLFFLVLYTQNRFK